MNQSIKEISEKVVSHYKKNENVVGVILFGSVVRNKFDEFSDIDVYVILEKKEKYSRYNFIENNLRIDILLDSIEDIKKYLHEEKYNIRRNISHMLAYGRILYCRVDSVKKIQKTAQCNLKCKTKYKKHEILMHKYSIEDFWSEAQRDFKKGDIFAFGLDSQLLVNNIMELFLKIHGEFLRRPDEMMNILKSLDKTFAGLILSFYENQSLNSRKDVLSKLVNYIYKQSGGPLPTKWFI